MSWLENGCIFVLTPTKLTGHRFSNKFIEQQNSSQFLYGITL